MALVGCSAAGGSDDPQLQQKLNALKSENAKLGQQLNAMSNGAFDRASKAEHKRNLKGKSRVLCSTRGSLRFDALVLGPLKFKKKTGTFNLDIGKGTGSGGLEDHPSDLRVKGGGGAPAKVDPDRGKKSPKKKRPSSKKKRGSKKKKKTENDEHNVIIRNKGGN